MPGVLGDAKAVFFDAGFTLIDSIRPVASVYYESARELGADIDAESFHARMKEMWPRLNAEYRSKHPNLESSEALERQAWHDFTWEVARPFPDLALRHDRWLRRLVEYFDDARAWKEIDGAGDVLRELRRNGRRIVVLSNWHEALEKILAGLELLPLCDGLVTSSRAGHKKPHGRVFEQGMERVNVAARDVVHIGDSWSEDVEGALHVGARAILFDPSRRCPKARPDVPVIGSLRELLS